MRRPSFFCLDVRFGLSKLTSQLRIGEIACDYLLVCNFADVLLVSLSFATGSWQRIDRDCVATLRDAAPRPSLDKSVRLPLRSSSAWPYSSIMQPG